VEAVSTRRGDIEALRALAVLAVVGYHANLPIKSGYLGVDVFLVISGFVICSSLIREWQKTNSINLRDFFIRRIRRLFLPLIFMLSFSMILFFLIGPLNAHRSVVDQAISALGFFANFHYFSLEGGYFQPAASETFFLHTWSLSLEEQFYLFFPFSVALFVYFARKMDKKYSYPILAKCLMLLALSSIFICWLITRDNYHELGFANESTSFFNRIKIDPDSFSFFSSLTRGWQFLLGAIVAVVTELRLNRPKFFEREVFTVTAISFLVYMLLYSKASENSFFAIGRISVTLITGVLLFLGFSGGGKFVNLIGEMSYSLYLWHFPLLMLAEIKFGSSAESVSVALVGSIVLSYFSLIFIERRSLSIRSDGFLSTFRKSLLLSILFFVSLVGLGKNEIPEEIAGSVFKSPKVADPIWALQVSNKLCALTGDGFSYTCEHDLPDSNSEVLLVGDSHALAMTAGFEYVASDLEVSWKANTAQGCTFARFSVGVQPERCDLWVEDVIKEVTQAEPDLIVIFQCNRVGTGCPNPGMSESERKLFVSGVKAIVGEINSLGIPILQILDTPAVSPESVSPSLFFNRLRVPIQTGSLANNQKIADVLRSFAGESGGLFFVDDISGGLCSEGSCTYVNEADVPLWFDTDHLSPAGVANRRKSIVSVMGKVLNRL
jgi:peptidoglycan/LPS O-acetylase OafA/YrhL